MAGTAEWYSFSELRLEWPMKKVDDGAPADSARAFVREQYRIHADAIFRKVLFLCRGNDGWAEDITHDAFVRLLERHHELLDRTSVGAWLHRVAYRLAIDRLRRERAIWGRIAHSLTYLASLGATEKPDRTVQVVDDLHRVLESLEQLQPRDRAVVVMKFLDGLTQHEIAEVVGVSESHVSKTVHRACAILRQSGWEIADD